MAAASKRLGWSRDLNTKSERAESELLCRERRDPSGRGDDGQGPRAVTAGREELQEVLTGGDLLHALDPPGAVPDGNAVALAEGEVHPCAGG
jgi:hypothetical protein